MTADLLVRAAAKIRETAQAADSGPWRPMNGNALPGRDGTVGEPEWFIDSPPTLIAHGPIKPTNAEHIATWSPDVAELVASWLDKFSEVVASGNSIPGKRGQGYEQARDLALRILGE